MASIREMAERLASAFRRDASAWDLAIPLAIALGAGVFFVWTSLLFEDGYRTAATWEVGRLARAVACATADHFGISLPWGALLLTLPLVSAWSGSRRRLAWLACLVLAAQVLATWVVAPTCSRTRMRASHERFLAELGPGIDRSMFVAAGSEPETLSVSDAIVSLATSPSPRLRELAAQRLAATLALAGALLPWLARRRLRFPWWLTVPLALGAWLVAMFVRSLARQASLPWSGLAGAATLVVVGGVAVFVSSAFGASREADGSAGGRTGALHLGHAFVVAVVAAASFVLPASRFGRDLTTLVPTRSPIGSEMADVTLETFDGRNVSLGELRGRIVVLTYWASWCGPCRRELPVLDQAEAARRNQPVTFLAMTVDDDEDAAKRFVAEEGLRLTVVRRSAALMRRFPRSGIPMTFVVDRSGLVRARHVGFGESSREHLDAVIDALLAEPAR